MNAHQPQHKTRAPRKCPSALARAAMMLAAVAYFFSALNIAPLLFVFVGLSLDTDHAAQVENVNGNIRVTLAHPDSHVGHAHNVEWFSCVVAGDNQEGHADHVANFAATGISKTSDSGEVTVKCPVHDLTELELNILTHRDARIVVNAACNRSDRSPERRALRPVVLLI